MSRIPTPCRERPHAKTLSHIHTEPGLPRMQGISEIDTTREREGVSAWHLHFSMPTSLIQGGPPVFSYDDPETFWLITTNLILGLVVLACVLIVARGVYQEVRVRIRNRSLLPATENPILVVPLVGPTMADGGEPIDRIAKNPDRYQSSVARKFRTGASEN